MMPSAPPPAGRALDLSGVGCVLGDVTALHGVDLRVERGERVAVIGPSGAGKTTLLRVAGAALFPHTGSVEVLGERPGALGERALRRLRCRIGTVHQHLHLVAQATVLENVLLGRAGRRGVIGIALDSLRGQDRSEVASLLAGFGLEDRIDERVDRLSGGEQQRVAVARVLWQGPDLVLADEPFASVDPGRSAEVARLLADASSGRTLIVSTHQVAPVRDLVDRFVGLRAGRLAFDVPRGRLDEALLRWLYRGGSDP